MSSATRTAATIDDLYRYDGKAELIAGKIVALGPTGYLPSRIAGRIMRSLDDHAESTGAGEVYAGTVAFVVPKLPSGRESFSPDLSYFIGPLPANEMRFLEGAPTFAVEVRSEGDYGNAAEAKIAAKWADYFEAGTAIVWDVDPINDRILKYRADAPDRPEVFLPGQIADAEPAVPGWRIDVDSVFG